MNNLHATLKYTVEEPLNNALIFVDMTIFLENGKYELKNYKKPQAFKVLTNFHSETPKNYKISSLMTI